ncbi:MAG: dTDP-4-dehydrorhamnose reductase [Xanthobacteraceae bacterium]
MSKLRIAVTGTRGQIVRSLLESVPTHDVEILPLGRPLLDLGDPATVHSALTHAAPDVVIGAAAYTDVERAESEPALAMSINGEGAGALAASAQALAIPIIQLSTDYVFDGVNSTPYREADLVNPLSAYGRSKAQGEAAVVAANPRHVILRTSWVYSPFGRNFVKAMIERAARQNEVMVVSDQVGSPTAATDIAGAILAVARHLVAGQNDEGYGVFHLAAAGTTSWADFAAAIFELSAERGGPSARIAPISSAQYRARAQRPSNSRLDCTKIAAIYGVSLPHWRASLVPCIERILERRE